MSLFDLIIIGAGPAGLSGMPVRNGRFVRPLLETTREEVISYLKDKNIPWREDSTNTEDIFLRNKIRHRLIPVLNEFFPSWKKGIGSMAEIQSLAADFIGSEAENRICWETASSSRSSFTTSESNFFNQSLIIREEAVFQGINLLSAQTVSVRGIKRYVVRDFCLGKMTACDLSLARITRKKGKIILAPAKKRVKKTVD
jgi:tRNA(Ile)-lysidine synthase